MFGFANPWRAQPPAASLIVDWVRAAFAGLHKHCNASGVRAPARAAAPAAWRVSLARGRRLIPVALPPGRARLATSPELHLVLADARRRSGSYAVAALAARAGSGTSGRCDHRDAVGEPDRLPAPAADHFDQGSPAVLHLSRSRPWHIRSLSGPDGKLRRLIHVSHRADAEWGETDHRHLPAAAFVPRAAKQPPRRREGLMNSRRRISLHPKLRGQHCIDLNEYFDRG